MQMQSGRNNFEMYMLVGFASAGQAIAHQKQMGLSNAYTPNKIRVSVAVPISKENLIPLWLSALLIKLYH